MQSLLAVKMKTRTVVAGRGAGGRDRLSNPGSELRLHGGRNSKLIRIYIRGGGEQKKKKRLGAVFTCQGAP